MSCLIDRHWILRTARGRPISRRQGPPYFLFPSFEKRNKRREQNANDLVFPSRRMKDRLFQEEQVWSISWKVLDLMTFGTPKALTAIKVSPFSLFLQKIVRHLPWRTNQNSVAEEVFRVRSSSARLAIKRCTSAENDLAVRVVRMGGWHTTH